MNLIKAVGYLALLIGVFVLVGFVASVVLTVLSLLWWLLTTAVTIAAVVGIVYGSYKLYTMVSGSEADSRATTRNRGRSPIETEPTSRGGSSVTTVQEQYANGDISEAELERRLERELDDPPMDSIDRELQRDRS